MMLSSEISTYRGRRDGNICLVTVNDFPLDSRPDILSLPLADFEWGYKGAGPARLAFAILAHYFQDDRRALGGYRSFCDSVIAELLEDEWLIATDAINGYLQKTVDVSMTLDELLSRARGLRR
jgi:hypothetical protein